MPFAEPFEFVLGYRLPDENGNQVFPMDYQMETKKWYLPAAATPYFNMSLFEGTPRRIQFTFNNTDDTIGKKHALKKYDQFLLLGKYQIKYFPSCAISQIFCHKNN